MCAIIMTYAIKKKSEIFKGDRGELLVRYGSNRNLIRVNGEEVQ